MAHPPGRPGLDVAGTRASRSASVPAQLLPPTTGLWPSCWAARSPRKLGSGMATSPRVRLQASEPASAPQGPRAAGKAAARLRRGDHHGPADGGRRTDSSRSGPGPVPDGQLCRPGPEVNDIRDGVLQAKDPVKENGSVPALHGEHWLTDARSHRSCPVELPHLPRPEFGGGVPPSLSSSGPRLSLLRAAAPGERGFRPCLPDSSLETSACTRRL